MKHAVLAAALVLVSSGLPVSAQLMLPGALHAPPPDGGGMAPSHAGDALSSGVARARTAPARQPPPSEATIVGRDLSRDGSAGQMAFETGAAKGLEIVGLSLAGEEISRPGELCRVDVVAGAPIEARYAGRLDGLSRYEALIEACPFSFEVLDGAVRVTRTPKSCDFAAADCRVDPTGLWGPPGEAIDARRIQQLERARAQAETNMRAHFRALLASAGKDKEAVKKIAGEQAGFSSARAVACRTYAGEDQHGFCALRMTEARGFALQAQHEAAVMEKVAESPAKAAMKKKPAP